MMTTHELTLRLAIVVACATLLTSCAATTVDSAATPRADNPLDAVVACLDEAGFPGFTVENGGVRAPNNIGEEQFDPMRAAVYECQQQAGFYTEGIPDSELPRLYALELIELECLEDLGYTAPEPPSEQTYVDEYGTSASWEAFNDVFDSLPPKEQTQELFLELQAKCPPPAFTFVQQ